MNPSKKSNGKKKKIDVEAAEEEGIHANIRKAQIQDSTDLNENTMPPSHKVDEEREEQTNPIPPTTGPLIIPQPQTQTGIHLDAYANGPYEYIEQIKYYTDTNTNLSEDIHYHPYLLEHLNSTSNLVNAINNPLNTLNSNLFDQYFDSIQGLGVDGSGLVGREEEEEGEGQSEKEEYNNQNLDINKTRFLDEVATVKEKEYILDKEEEEEGSGEITVTPKNLNPKPKPTTRTRTRAKPQTTTISTKETPRPRSRNWDLLETAKFTDLILEHQHSILNMKKKSQIWESISQKMTSSGHNRTALNCKNKWKALIFKYKKLNLDLKKGNGSDNELRPKAEKELNMEPLVRLREVLEKCYEEVEYGLVKKLKSGFVKPNFLNRNLDFRFYPEGAVGGHEDLPTYSQFQLKVEDVEEEEEEEQGEEEE